ncbi:hypothetical protein [Streptomyces canus]|uniref:hypothetical protein n=1 Tax=Streptomyces canus TaxID=58343 RepID=UPI003F5410D0
MLFTGAGPMLRTTGVVDWAETSWGPADLDVARCSTALAPLHRPTYGLEFHERYEAHCGRELTDNSDHLYCRLIDALHSCPGAANPAGPWRGGARRSDVRGAGERLEARMSATRAGSYTRRQPTGGEHDSSAALRRRYGQEVASAADRTRRSGPATPSAARAAPAPYPLKPVLQLLEGEAARGVPYDQRLCDHTCLINRPSTIRRSPA